MQRRSGLIDALLSIGGIYFFYVMVIGVVDIPCLRPTLIEKEKKGGKKLVDTSKDSSNRRKTLNSGKRKEKGLQERC